MQNTDLVDVGLSTETSAPMSSSLSQDHPAAFAETLGLVGVSAYVRGLRQRIRAVAVGSVPVLIQGDSGTGKEVVAKAVHACSSRAGHAMLTVNCAAVPKHLEESEFFGHVKGAFTGAEGTRPGLVAQADGSTLFLDELGETSADTQAKLLRVLDSGEFYPVGSAECSKTDIRVVSATNRDLEEMVDRGFFREDLYYRLRGIVLHTEPLRRHIDDIAPLVSHFVRLSEDRYLPDRFTPGALRLLAEHAWPGNVRELRYTIDVLRMAAADRGEVDARVVRSVLDLNLDPDITAYEPYRESRTRVLEDFDRRYFAGLLSACGGNVSKVARTAGLHRPSVQRKLAALGLDASTYRMKNA